MYIVHKTPLGVIPKGEIYFVCLASFSDLDAVVCHFSTPSVFSFWKRIFTVNKINFKSKKML